MGNIMNKTRLTTPANQENSENSRQPVKETKNTETVDIFYLVSREEKIGANMSTADTRPPDPSTWQRIRSQLRRFSSFFKAQSSNNERQSEIEQGRASPKPTSHDTETDGKNPETTRRHSDAGHCESNDTENPHMTVTDEDRLEWIFAVQQPISFTMHEMYQELQIMSQGNDFSQLDLTGDSKEPNMYTECRTHADIQNASEGLSGTPTQSDKPAVKNSITPLLPLDKKYNEAKSLKLKSSFKQELPAVKQNISNTSHVVHNDRIQTNPNTGANDTLAHCYANQEVDLHDKTTQGDNADKTQSKPVRPKLKVSWSLDFESGDTHGLETINENIILATPPIGKHTHTCQIYTQVKRVSAENEQNDTCDEHNNGVNNNIISIEAVQNVNKDPCCDEESDDKMDISNSDGQLSIKTRKKSKSLIKLWSKDTEKLEKNPLISSDNSKRFKLMRLFGKQRSVERDPFIANGLKELPKTETSEDRLDQKVSDAISPDHLQESPKWEDLKHRKWRRATAASIGHATTPSPSHKRHDSDFHKTTNGNNIPARRQSVFVAPTMESDSSRKGANEVAKKKGTALRSRSLSVDLGGSRSRRNSDATDSPLAMFGRKNHGDVKKSAIKVLDPKKDNLTRLKHLRIVLDAYDSHEAKSFFDQNYSHIYFVFYEAFTGVESDLKQRANKSHRDELDYVIFIFEKILTLLPELIHKRWQYHSIGRIMKKLLHSGNSLKLRREGMRLFLVWYQILMDNATEECHVIYSGLVPKLGSSSNPDVDIFTRSGTESFVSSMEVTPVLLPQSGDKQPDNLTKWLLETLLTFSVSEVKKIEWTNKEMHHFSFTFLFEKFKEFYLLKIFPNFSKVSSIYEPSLDLPSDRSLDTAVVDSPQRPFEVALCQEVLVKWLAIYAHASKNEQPFQQHPAPAPRTEKSEDEEVVMNGEQIEAAPEDKVPGSNASTLSNASGYTEKDSMGSSISSDDQALSEQDIVCQVLYANRDNVNMVHEVFRQAFLFPFSHSGAMRKVIAVYKEWFHDDSKDHRPPFFVEPDEGENEAEDFPDGGSPPPSSKQPMRASEEVKAGMQPVLQVFITNSANVFLLEQSQKPEFLEGQVDMCKRVLNIYRYMVMNMSMDQKTWEQLLKVLLKIVAGVLSLTPPKRKENTLGGKLAQPLFQTLIVTWIKANLNVFISAELWDHFLQVLSSLTGWVELVREWAKTMETLTRVLARQVYGLDLNDLPLNRLSAQKGIKNKQKQEKRSGQGPGSRGRRERTFSRGWSRHEMVESIRAQLLRTSEQAGHGPTIQRQTLAVNIPVHRHQIHSVSVSRAITGVALLGLGVSQGDNLGEETSVFRSHSVAVRPRSRSGQSSPVRGQKLSDPGPEPSNLVRSNSDTSLMVNFEGKGSKEILFDDDDRTSLNEEALGTYYSASEDMDEEDVLFAVQRAAEKSTKRSQSQASLPPRGSPSPGTDSPRHSPREEDDDGPAKKGDSTPTKLDKRKFSTVSTVSLGETSFNLEDATDIPHSNSAPNFLFSEQDYKQSPRNFPRRLRPKLSKDDAFDDGLDDVDCAVKQDLDDIREVPKVLETDLDDLSLSSQSTVASKSEAASPRSDATESRSETPVPTIVVTKANDAIKRTGAVRDKARSRESSPSLERKVQTIYAQNEVHDGNDSAKDELEMSENTVSNREDKRENNESKELKTDSSDERDECKDDRSANDESICANKVENQDTVKTTNSIDENRNKLLQINVDEKGNVTKILVHDKSSPMVAKENAPDGQEAKSETAEGTRSAESGADSGDRGLVKRGSSVLRPEDVDQSYGSTAADDASLASVDSSPMIPYQEVSTDSSVNCDKSSLGERSDTEVLLRISESGSGSEAHRSMSSESPESSKPTKQESVSPSAVRHTDVMESIEEKERESLSSVDVPRYKDSPTPDRESLHIEETVTHKSSQNGSKSGTALQASEEEDLQSVDMRSILAGGNLTGWTPDVAVVIWRRLLGVLGDVNQISDPIIHELVFEHLCEFIDTLNKMRDNLSVSLDNQNSPAPPELLPPVWLFTPWLLEALNLPEQYKQGRLLACQLLCSCLLRRHDLEIDELLLTRFYEALHIGLMHTDQDTTNVFVRHCGPRFFSLPLPGSSMMILDFIHAASSIASTTELKHAPRAEAMSVLGAMLCFPNHFGTIQVLQPDSVELAISECSDIKDELISILLKSGRKEPAGLARCIAISSLGMFLYEEVLHNPGHPKIEETVKVLLSTLRFSNKAVAQVATDMLLLLCDHVPILLTKQPSLCERIIDSTCTAIHCLLSATERSNSLEDKRLLVSIMFCLLEWSLSLPMDMLLKTFGGHKCLLYKIFRVLNLSVTGTHGILTPRDSQTDMYSQEDNDLDAVREGPNSSNPGTPLDPPVGFGGRTIRTKDHSTDIIKIAARTVMSHLVNHLCHFPMGGGAARMNSGVQECHDIDQYGSDELTPQLFEAPTVQFFVVNSTTLMSFVEIPALTNLPGGGVTAGLTTGKTVTRLVIRDIGGRYCWDNSVLYGPPMCRAGSFPAEPKLTSLEIVEDMDQICKGQGEQLEVPERDPEQLPLYNTLTSAKDNLDELLVYIGHTSPECQLFPGESLNVPFHAPVELSRVSENKASESLVREQENEASHVSQHINDEGLRASAMKPTQNCDTSAPFHLCRLYLNQLGYMQWGKRSHFDLLKKSDALLRELKNLDNQKCRETHKIAVIYVAEGQEDKQSVLGNTAGSVAYEEFVSGLGWEVDLEHHPGFLGGLSTNKSTGVSAPYYATSTKEVIFHVSTRMPVETEEHKVKKLRHLGNDEVQIIWSEHTRDYRRGIIPTEFGDVLIIIYPLQSGLYRIHIDRKPEVPYFGPLFDGAIVPFGTLVGLVRATAVNASHMLRTLKPMYRSFYEERAKYLETLVEQHKEPTTFEDFAAKVFAPVLPQGSDLAGTYVPEPILLPNGQSLRSDADPSDQRSQSSAEKSEKSSPQASSKSKESEGISMFNRRLSFGKSKKSVTKQMQQQRESVATPPGSPNSNYRA